MWYTVILYASGAVLWSEMAVSAHPEVRSVGTQMDGPPLLRNRLLYKYYCNSVDY